MIIKELFESNPVVYSSFCLLSPFAFCELAFTKACRRIAKLFLLTFDPDDGVAFPGVTGDLGADLGEAKGVFDEGLPRAGEFGIDLTGANLNRSCSSCQSVDNIKNGWENSFKILSHHAQKEKTMLLTRSKVL